MTFAIVAALAAGIVLDGSVRADARAGTTTGGQSPSAAGLALDLSGLASDPDGTLRFGVAPSAVLADGKKLFARGFIERDQRLGSSTWARLRQSLGYGSADLTLVAPTSVRGPVVAPPGGFVTIEESNTSLELDVGASKRLRIVGSAAWVVNGGANANARSFLPLARGPLVRASLAWSATRRDTLRIELQGFDYRYLADQPANDRRSSVASLAVAWVTQLSRSARLSISLGPGVGRSELRDQPARTVAYAVGGAELRAAFARDLSAGIAAGAEPLGDPTSGEVVELGSVRAFALWGRQGGVALAAGVIGSLALTSGAGGPTSPQAGDRYLRGELTATIPLDARSGLSLGGRSAYLSRPVSNQPSDQWVAFVTYVAQVPLLR